MSKIIISEESMTKLDWAFSQIIKIMEKYDLDSLTSKKYQYKVIRLENAASEVK